MTKGAVHLYFVGTLVYVDDNNVTRLSDPD
jgi:hypothetical protein